METLLGLTLGALEIGILLSTFLYGIVTMQTFLFTERMSRDPVWLRVMIYILWIFETFHTVVDWILLYSLSVTNYGNINKLSHTPWTLALTVPLTSCVGAIVQVYFAWRIRILGGHLAISMISWIMAVVRLVCGTLLAVFILKSRTVGVFFGHYQWLVDTLLILNAAIDILNTSSFCYYLLRRRSAFKETRRVVDRLILFTVETGLLTSLCAVAVLTCSLVMTNNFIFLGIFMVYPKLFSNSLLTSLNSRKNLPQGMSIADGRGFWSTRVSLSRQVSDSKSFALSARMKPVGPSVHISQQTLTVDDGTSCRAI